MFIWAARSCRSYIVGLVELYRLESQLAAVCCRGRRSGGRGMAGGGVEYWGGAVGAGAGGGQVGGGQVGVVGAGGGLLGGWVEAGGQF